MKRITALLLVMVAFICYGSAQTANVVDITMSQGDTIWAGIQMSFQISLENDIPLGGLGLGFRIWSPDGATWTWDNFGGYGSTGAVTVNPCSRMYPPENVFDMTGLLVEEQDVNGVLPDTIMVGGVSLAKNLPVGPREQMFSFHGRCYGMGTHVLCIDSVTVGAAGAFVFVNTGGNNLVPTVAWNEGGRCYLVRDITPPSPTLVYSKTNHVQTYSCDTVFIENALTWEDQYGGEQISIFFAGIPCNGAGEASVIDHGDGTCDIQYIPSPDDVGKTVPIVIGAHTQYSFSSAFMLLIDVEQLAGDCNNDCEVNVGDVVFLVNYVFRHGPAPENLNCSDVNTDCSVDVGDAVYLLNYVFKNGPAPTCSDCVK